MRGERGKLWVAAALAVVMVGGAGTAGAWMSWSHGAAARRPLSLPKAPAALAPTGSPAEELPTSTAPASTATIALIAPTPASRLGSRLDAALGSSSACLVVHDGPATVYERGPVAPFAPASTQKLLVAAAALAILGPDYRFTTTVVAPAPPRAGAVDALWLVGGGDALLASPEFAAQVAQYAPADGLPLTPLGSLADAVAAAGVRTVAGPVHGDASRYSGVGYLPTWSPIYRTEKDIGVLSALTVNEGLQQWRPPALATDPSAFAASELARLLTNRGLAVRGPADDQVAPRGGVVLAQLPSAPLSQIVGAMLRASDNLVAELLVREIDRHGGGTGTTSGGIQRVLEQDAALGLPLGSAHLNDGSGLDTANRVTCSLLLAALNLGSRPGFKAIISGLAVAGQSGTLVHRFVGTPLAGHLAAKTGWVNNVAGMVGQLQLPGHPALRFALLVNQPMRYADAEAIENRVVQALTSYPER